MAVENPVQVVVREIVQETVMIIVLQIVGMVVTVGRSKLSTMYEAAEHVRQPLC